MAPLHRTADGISLSLIAAMLVLAALTWTAAPDRVPVHWGPSGEPDRYGGKIEGVLAAPGAAIALYLLLLFLPRLDPLRRNYDRFAAPYAWVRTLTVAFLFGIYLLLLAWIRGTRVPVGMAVSILVGLLFVGLGVAMTRFEPNWFAGIRTPWTLSSPTVWRRTHRVGGWLFAAIGAIAVLGGLARQPWTLPVTVGLAIAWAVLVMVYSYVTWRSDPQRS